MCVCPDKVRINKFISDSGFCSRRDADYDIEQGRVTVDGVIAAKGMLVSEDQDIRVEGRRIHSAAKMILIAVNKPVGIVSTSEVREKDNIVDFLNHPKRIFPMGRLDKDSEGLILMTNDGDLVNMMMRSRYVHEKEYIVTVHKTITKAFIEKMGAGVPILGTVTRKCLIERIGNKKFRIILTQGLNRQIRRMCEHLGYEVVRLKRTRIMNIELGDLKEGEYRDVTEDERKVLFRMLEGSTDDAPLKKIEK
jgi:23S rRNA pseudouridine2604 synthase